MWWLVVWQVAIEAEGNAQAQLAASIAAEAQAVANEAASVAKEAEAKAAEEEVMAARQDQEKCVAALEAQEKEHAVSSSSGQPGRQGTR